MIKKCCDCLMSFFYLMDVLGKNESNYSLCKHRISCSNGNDKIKIKQDDVVPKWCPLKKFYDAGYGKFDVCCKNCKSYACTGKDFGRCILSKEYRNNSQFCRDFDAKPNLYETKHYKNKQKLSEYLSVKINEILKEKNDENN